MEIWKRFRRTNYLVSSDGRIKHEPKDRIVKQTLGHAGYLQIAMRDKGKAVTMAVHRMVAEVFHGESPFTRAHVHHKNGDKQCNHETNLQWASALENKQYGRALAQIARGEAAGPSRLTEAQVVEMLMADHYFRESLSVKFGLTRQGVAAILNRQSWRHVELAALEAGA